MNKKIKKDHIIVKGARQHNLQNINVKKGEQVKQGDIIGTVGSTGRSTGPHLDFRVNWFQTRLDPMSVLN